MRGIQITSAAVVAFLLLVVVAFAHQVTSFVATCEGNKATFAGFSESNKPVSWVVSVDNVQKLNGSFTFTGSSGTLTADYSQPLPAGDHVVNFVATWPNQGDENGKFSQTVHGCAGPPTPPTPPPAPPVVTPPAEQPPATVPPAEQPPAVSTPTTTTSQPTPHPDNAPPRRFGVPGHPTKKCAHGRKHLKDSNGRHFTMCRRHAVPPIVRRPEFTG
jgi:hypothetical protein